MGLGVGAYKVGGAWGGGIHGNPASGPHQAPTQYLPSPYLKKEGGMGKTKAQTDTQTASYYMRNNTLRRTASKQLRI